MGWRGFSGLRPAIRNPRPTRQRVGHGVGLIIVERLSDRFGWPLQMHSVLGQGTAAPIQFPSASAVREGPFPCGDGAD